MGSDTSHGTILGLGSQASVAQPSWGDQGDCRLQRGAGGMPTGLPLARVTWLLIESQVAVSQELPVHARTSPQLSPAQVL